MTTGSPAPAMMAQAMAHLKELCQKLCLDEVTHRRALMLFQSTECLMSASYPGDRKTDQEWERLWVACVLFCVKKLSSGTTVGGEVVQGGQAGFTLSQLLRHSNERVVDFLNELGSFVIRAGQVLDIQFGYGAEKRLQVKELEGNFVNMTILFNHYKKTFLDYFGGDNGTPEAAPAPGTVTPPPVRANPPPGSKHMRLGWLLFLVMKARLLPQYPDLVTAGHALICTIHIQLLHVPASARRFSFADVAKFPRRANVGVDLLGSLCEQYKAAEDNVAELMTKVHELLGALLGRPASLQAQRTRSSGEQLGGLDTHAKGFGIYDSFMDGPGLDTSLRKIEKTYEETLQSGGDIDERVFLDPDSVCTIGTPSQLTPITKLRSLMGGGVASPLRASALSPPRFMSSPMRANSTYSSPVRSSSTISGPRAPLRTPMSSAMSTASWLRQLLGQAPLDLSASAKALLQGPDLELVQAIREQSEGLALRAFAHWSEEAERCGGAVVLNQQWAEERRSEALKLYWRLLSAMLTAEARRLDSRDFSKFLGNDTFHKALLAACAEIVLASHKATVMAFPAVLKPAGITPFDIGKVIEHVVRNEETLPRVIKRHLNTVEERVLESMAWERGSSFYSTFVECRRGRMGSADSAVEEVHTLRLLPEPAEPPPAPPDSSALASPRPTTSNGSPASPFRKDIAALGARQGSAFSPIRPTPRPLQALPPAFATPSRPVKGSLRGEETCGDVVLSVFFQKVLKLVAIRVRVLGERLHLPAAVLEQVYAVMQHILTKETSLFFCRHVDQPMLCAIYGVCKVRKVDVTFKTIIESYRKMPQCRPDVIRNVILQHEQPPTRPRAECADIIKFYNQVFVPRVKSLLFDLAKAPPPTPARPTRSHDEASPPSTTGNAQEGPTTAPRSPELVGISNPKAEGSPFRALPNVSPKKFGKQVYVSPLRPSKAEALMSSGGHSRSLFASVGECPQPFQSPSRMYSALNERIKSTSRPRTLGRLKFDDDDSAPGTSSGSGATEPAGSRPVRQNGTHDTASQPAPGPQSPPSKRLRVDGQQG